MHITEQTGRETYQRRSYEGNKRNFVSAFHQFSRRKGCQNRMVRLRGQTRERLDDRKAQGKAGFREGRLGRPGRIRDHEASRNRILFHGWIHRWEYYGNQWSPSLGDDDGIW